MAPSRRLSPTYLWRSVLTCPVQRNASYCSTTGYQICKRLHSSCCQWLHHVQTWDCALAKRISCIQIWSSGNLSQASYDTLILKCMQSHKRSRSCVLGLDYLPSGNKSMEAWQPELEYQKLYDCWEYRQSGCEPSETLWKQQQCLRIKFWGREFKCQLWWLWHGQYTHDTRSSGFHIREK